MNSLLLRTALRTACPDAPAADIERVIETCNGDIRHAILCLQLTGRAGQALSAQDATAKPKRKSTRDLAPVHVHPTLLEQSKDDYLNTFHALGKLLYAKRMLQCFHPPTSLLSCLTQVLVGAFTLMVFPRAWR